MTLTAGRAGRLTAALAIAALSLLPIATWIPGGEVSDVLVTMGGPWLRGTLLTAAAALFLAYLSREVPALWRPGAWAAFVARADLLRPGRALALAIACALVYGMVTARVFAFAPLNIDQIDQIWQARLFAGGHLTAPVRGLPEFFGVLFLDERGGQVFSQFPAGGPAMLALGSWARAEWAVGPCFAAFGVWCWARTLRAIDEPPVSATNALLLLAFSPFALLMSGSFMNHVTTEAWLLAGMAALATVTTATRPRPGLAFLGGLAFGLAASIRPVEGFVFGAPAGLWLLGRAVRDRSRAAECLLAGLGMAVPVGALLWVNAATTGDAFLFAYTHLWGPGHGIGFHEAPWGPRHTPVRGLEYLHLYLAHLQARFLETPFPSLLPALGVLGAGERFRPFDRYLLTSAFLLLGCYWAYWFKGLFLGPRFLYPLLPLAALFTARAGSLIAARFGPASLSHRSWTYAAGVAAVVAFGVNIPQRLDGYRGASPQRRWSLPVLAASAGARDALVLVRESWGEQVRNRMAGRGLSPTEVERVYWRSDICKVEQVLERLEEEDIRDSAAVIALLPLVADSALVVPGLISPDATERIIPREISYPGCVTRLLDDRAGFTLYSPTLLDDRSGNVYIQDQYARDSLVLLQYPDRPVFLLAPADATPGAQLSFRPLSRDSLMQSWRRAPGAEGRAP